MIVIYDHKTFTVQANSRKYMCTSHKTLIGTNLFVRGVSDDGKGFSSSFQQKIAGEKADLVDELNRLRHQVHLTFFLVTDAPVKQARVFFSGKL
jgi:hypothetical protein